VDDESHREEMNAAIRAQRERGAVPRSMLPPEEPEPPAALEPEPEEPDEPAEPGLVARLLRRRP